MTHACVCVYIICTFVGQDSNDCKSAFTHAGNMLKELKTTQLSPRNYYELYMKVNMNLLE